MDTQAKKSNPLTSLTTLARKLGRLLGNRRDKLELLATLLLLALIVTLDQLGRWQYPFSLTAVLVIGFRLSLPAINWGWLADVQQRIAQAGEVLSEVDEVAGSQGRK